MTEIIADLETIVTSPTGTTYFVQVVGEQIAAHSWEAWLNSCRRTTSSTCC